MTNTAPTQAAQTSIPADVLAALDRMCTPLHESHLKGVTAEADARSMKIIRDYIFAASEARDVGELTDERLMELAVDYLHIDYDRMPAGMVPLLRVTIALATRASEAAPSAFQTLKNAPHADPDYAWAWHCNLAMPIMDAIRCTPEQANKAGADLMQYLFGIDVRKFKEWHHDAPADEPVQDTGNVEADRIIGRLMSADPDFSDCTDAAAIIRRLVAAPVAVGDAKRDAVIKECIDAIMTAVPDRNVVRKIGEAAYYVSAADAVRALAAQPASAASSQPAAPAVDSAPIRHSWAVSGMERDPEGVWVLAGHAVAPDAAKGESK